MTEIWRNKIKTSSVLNRLANHIVGKCDMSQTQVRAAEILLNKTLPNLSAAEIDLSGDVTSRVVSAEPLSEAQWNKQYTDKAATVAGTKH